MTPIPKIIHLHHFFGSSLTDPLSTASYYKQMMPDYDVILTTEPDSEFLDEYDNIFNNPNIEDRHKADVLRYWYLYEYGGIYVDLDTRPLKRFDDLLESDIPQIAGVQFATSIVPYFCFVVTPPKCNIWKKCLQHCRVRIQHGATDVFNIASMSEILDVKYLVDIVCDLGVPQLGHYIMHFRQSHEVIPEQEYAMDSTITRGGQMVFPHKGTAPSVPEGYEATNDPFVFMPILLPCPHRTITAKTTKCCGARNIIDCAKYRKRVTRRDCKACQDKGENV